MNGTIAERELPAERQAMSWAETEDYVAEHYGRESAADMAEATGRGRQEIYQITFKLKRNGRIAASRESWGSTQGPSAATGKRQKVAVTAPPPTAAPRVRCEHKHWLTGPDAVIEGKYPDFFKDGAHSHVEHPYEWQVCQECDYAEPIRPKYPWDKGISVALAPNRDGLHWPSPERTIEVVPQEPVPVDVIDEPGSEVAGEVLLEAEGDPGDEQPVHWAAPLPEPWGTMYVDLEANVPQPPSLAEAIFIGLREALEKTRAELEVARKQARYWKLHVELAHLEHEADQVRAEIDALGAFTELSSGTAL